MATLQFELKEGCNISNKITLAKKLLDFDAQSQSLEVRVTGKVFNPDFGSEKISYEIVSIKRGKIILVHKAYGWCIGKKWDIISEAIIDVFICDK